MKRLLIVTEVFYPESGLINDLALELVQRGYKVDVLTQHPSYPLGKVYDGYVNESYRIDSRNGINIHRFKLIEGYRESKLRKILNYYLFVRQGSKIAKRIGCNYDHVLVYQTGPLTVALPGVAIKTKYGIPLTVWTFDIWPDAVYAYGFPRILPLKMLLNWILKKVYRNSDNILVSSSDFRDVVARYAPDKEIGYAPNWLVDEEPEKTNIKLDRSKFNYTFTGNISRSQNLENVLLGWKRCKISDATLNLVGDGSSLPILQQLVEKYQVTGVCFHGRCPSRQISDILQQSDVLVLPLVSDEGIKRTEPFKLQSYLKAGKPILGVIEGAGRKIIERNKLGICTSPDNIEQIAEGFNKIRNLSVSERQIVKERAQELMATRFNRLKSIETVISCIEKRQ